MKTALQVMSWVSVAFGALAILGGVAEPADSYAILGGIMFLTQGVLALVYIAEKK